MVYKWSAEEKHQCTSTCLCKTFHTMLRTIITKAWICHTFILTKGRIFASIEVIHVIMVFHYSAKHSKKTAKWLKAE